MEVFLETSTEEYDENITNVCTMLDRKIQDIHEKVGEFKVNITRRVDEFISNHKLVIQNIIEIRKLRSEISAQNTEIKEVINDYKTFKREEGEKENEREIKDWSTGLLNHNGNHIWMSFY